VTAQIRVYRWSQVNGQEKLEPTGDVAASPPASTLPPGGMQTVRLVRTRKDPIVGEESYRLFIDQLPQPAQARTGLVSLVVRHSIPAFFRSAELSSASVSWSAEIARGSVTVTARNDGQRRMRIARLQVRDAKGSTVQFGEGLVGYALGKSSMRWTARAGHQGLGAGQLSVSAQTDVGAVNAVAGRKVTP
jgi:fimbrial chaperone protein